MFVLVHIRNLLSNLIHLKCVNLFIIWELIVFKVTSKQSHYSFRHFFQTKPVRTKGYLISIRPQKWIESPNFFRRNPFALKILQTLWCFKSDSIGIRRLEWTYIRNFIGISIISFANIPAITLFLFGLWELWSIEANLNVTWFKLMVLIREHKKFELLLILEFNCFVW